jgi:hypothetical protein
MKADLTGKWSGRYTYNLPPVKEDTSHPGFGEFAMDLRQFWFGFFRGTYRDLECGREFEEGAVSGFLRHHFIRLKKRPPVFYAYSNREYVPLLDQLEKTFGKRPQEWPPPPIEYQGRYGTESNLFRGQWRIRSWIAPIPTGGIYRFPEVSGNWEMKRVE